MKTTIIVGIVFAVIIALVAVDKVSYKRGFEAGKTFIEELNYTEELNNESQEILTPANVVRDIAFHVPILATAGHKFNDIKSYDYNGMEYFIRFMGDSEEYSAYELVLIQEKEYGDNMTHAEGWQHNDIQGYLFYAASEWSAAGNEIEYIGYLYFEYKQEVYVAIWSTTLDCYAEWEHEHEPQNSPYAIAFFNSIRPVVYDDDYNGEYELGYLIGYDSGRVDGYDHGYDVGGGESYDEGYQDGYTDCKKGLPNALEE